MEKFDPIDIDFIINNSEVKASTEKVKTDLKSVGQTAEETAAKVNSQLKGAFGREDNASAVEALNKGLKEQGAIVTRNKPAYNGLGNSINQISREMSAFTVSAQTGFLAVSNNIPILADEINRLKARNAELTASGQKAVPVWKQVVKGLFSWQTALSVGITLLTIYGSEVVKWVSTLFKGKDAIDELKASQKALNDTFSSGSYKKVIADVLQLRSYIKLAKEGVIDKDVALKKYNETLGKVSTEVTNLADAEQGVIDKAPAYVKAMLYKSAAAAASAEAAAKLAESTKRQNEIEEEIKAIEKRKAQPVSGGFNPTAPGSVNVSGLKQQADINNANKELNALIAERNKLNESSLKVVTKLNEEAAKIAKDAGLDIFGEEENNKNKTVSAYQSLLDKLSELDKEYSRKSFTKDEEELQALRDKFDKIRQLVERFNADPKNKAQIIDLSNLDQLQVKAEASLTYRQTTEKLKEELNAQQKLFAEFETYKQQFGIAAAKKEFEGKTQEAVNYYDFIKKLQKDNEEAYKAVDTGSATGAQIERVKLLNEALATEGAKQKKLFNSQLADLLNYQEKRSLLIEKYEATKAKLISEGKNSAVAELEKLHQEELDTLDDANAKKLQSYTALFEGINRLTVKEAKIVIANAKALLKTQAMSADLKAKILKQIAEVEQMLQSTNIDEIYKLAGALGNLGNSLANLGNDIGNTTLTNLGSTLGDLAGGAQSLFGAFAEGATTGDIISGGIGALTTVIGLIGRSAQIRERNRQIDEAYYLQVIAFQNQYNLSIAEQIRLQSILAENVFITNSEGRIKDALAAIDEITGKYSEALNDLRDNAEFDIKAKLKLDGYDISSWFKFEQARIDAIIKAGSLENYLDIFNTYPELIQTSVDGVQGLNIALAENLIANKLVTDETAQILQNIIDWQTELENARAQIKEVISNLASGLGDELKTLLVDAFQSGEDAAIKMGDTVEKVLENILSSLIFNNIFGAIFDDLEAQMAESFDIGGDGSWVDDFGRFFTQANALTNDFNTALADAQAQAANFGFGVFDGENAEPNQGLAGALRRELTEATGSELTGLFRGQYDVTKRLLEATEIYYEKENRHQANLIDLISITTKIESNTANTVLELQTAVVELRKIAENTEKIYINDIGG